MEKPAGEELQERIREEIASLCSGQDNSLGDASTERAWGGPMVGFARGDDPLFDVFKAQIGPFYWTPEEAFALAYPEEDVCAEQLGVLSYLLPQTEATRRDQKAQQRFPAERWTRSRFFGERFNQAMRAELVQRLHGLGYQALAPELLPGWARRQSESLGLASNWSERHTAHACGLGTFGLSDGLITPAGKAVRFGSVVIRARFAPSPRPYDNHRAWCLYFARGTCGLCIGRCPVSAIDEGGHDKERCSRYIREETTPYSLSRYGIEVNNCGLCQVGIPCESRIPPSLAPKAS